MDQTAQDRLVESSHEADLVVVGSHGRGRPARMAIGSITRHVMTDAACPVAVIEDDRSHKVHSLDLGSATGRRTAAVDIPV